MALAAALALKADEASESFMEPDEDFDGIMEPYEDFDGIMEPYEDFDGIMEPYEDLDSIMEPSECLDEMGKIEIEIPKEMKKFVAGLRENLRAFLKENPEAHTNQPDPEADLIDFVDQYNLPIAKQDQSVIGACAKFSNNLTEKTLAACNWQRYDDGDLFAKINEYPKLAEAFGYATACTLIKLV
jgi:hypothetical protein